MENSQGRVRRWTWFVTFNVCAAVAGTLVFGTSLIGILVEARQVWREGTAAFSSDAGMRLFVGGCIGILSAAPYLLLARAARKTGPVILFAVAALSMLAFQIWFMTCALFFARSSTAPIGILFMPLYLVVAAGAIWAVAALARAAGLTRSPG